MSYEPFEKEWLHALDERDRLGNQRDQLREALEDMLSGWRYIREAHGDLYGVGWDRAEEQARAALKATEEG